MGTIGTNKLVMIIYANITLTNVLKVYVLLITFGMVILVNILSAKTQLLSVKVISIVLIKIITGLKIIQNARQNYQNAMKIFKHVKVRKIVKIIQLFKAPMSIIGMFMVNFAILYHVKMILLNVTLNLNVNILATYG